MDAEDDKVPESAPEGEARGPEAPPEEDAPLRPEAPSYEITRFLFLRLLGVIYSFAFLVLVRQGPGLIGEQGLLPAASFVARATAAFGLKGAFTRAPSLFFLIGAGDGTLSLFWWVGFAVSVAVALGLTNAAAQLVLWAIYLSFIHVGQVFYGYGWESLLVETGFLAIFLCPVRTASPFPKAAVPKVPIWLLRWLIFRVMLGAGLIKLRGDPCWRDLTCLVYHYETQPSPSPLSYLFHSLPVWMLKGGVLFNHLAEVVAPFFVFWPRKARLAAGIVIVVFQLLLIVSGNLSFFNWLTIAPALACFDDAFLRRAVPKRLSERLLRVKDVEPPLAARVATYGYGMIVAVLSISPTMNLLSSRQAMNTSFDPLRLVSTYGAFGSVGRERFEVILEGTDSASPGPDAVWREYQFPCKPGDPDRRPCVASPYHYRLDWQLWFASFRGYRGEPWIVNLVYKLLRGDRGVKSLIAVDPFPETPPRWIKATLYRYELKRVGEGPGWWRRSPVSEFLKPLSLQDPSLLQFLAAHKFISEDKAPPLPRSAPPEEEEDE
ncbi:MAG: lipase maturation factor family protein [Polyangiaceae bacterium]